MIHVGVDNGKSGAVAAVQDGKLIAWMPMPLKNDGQDLDVDKLEVFLRHLNRTDLFKVTIEGAQKFSAGTLALCSTWYIFGQLTGSLSALGHSYSVTNPRTWQKDMLPKHDKGESKQAALQKFSELFKTAPPPLRPKGTKPHDGIVDAALIAAWAEVSSQNVRTQTVQ